MTVRAPADGEPSIEELVFLARSRHRIRLITELSDEERSRRELHEATGISQPTLGRILGDFEDRRWIQNHHNGAYALTPLGSLVAGTIDDALHTLDTVTSLTDVAEDVPWDRLDFEPAHLRSATITSPSPAEPLAHMRRFDELAARASTVEVFSNVLTCAPANEPGEADQEFLAHVDELVVTADALAADLDPELAGWLRDRLEAGDLSLYRRDEPADVLLGVFDDAVGLVPIDDAGMPSALIEAEADPIRSWVRDTLAVYRDTGTPVSPETLTAMKTEP